MTCKLTREQVIALITEHSYDSALVDALEYLLAAMDSEPVAYIFKHPSGKLFWALTDESNKGRRDVMPVYAAPQPAPVVMDDEKLRALFDAWFASDCSFDQSPEASEADNIAWRESYWYVWQRCRAAMLQAEPVTTANKLGNSPVIPDGSEDTKRLNWLDAQNKRLNEYYGTSYGWKFDANFQRNAMMLNDSNYPVMTVRQAIDEAIAAAPQEVKGE
ncbi:TPA: hypothetical protein ACIJVK_002602 [Klebsiella aerogenes]